jgi:hypothetical protein
MFDSKLLQCYDKTSVPAENYFSLLDNTRNNADGQVKKDRFLLWKYRYISHKIAYNHSVKICGRYHYKDLSIEVWKGNNNKSYYKNLVACNSVWACPVCRFKILNHRKSEIIEINKAAKDAGLYAGFLTLTARHDRYEDIESITGQIKLVNEAWRYLMSIPSLKKLINKAGFEYVKVLEIRYNKTNGYHPHPHIEVFANSREDSEMICNAIIDYWIKRFPGSLPEYQVYEPVFHDLDEQLEKYITKLGLSDEMTDPYLNKKSSESINPLYVLDMILKKDFTKFTELECIKIYNDYIQATKGLRSITWSQGFKKKYNIAEISDSEIVSNTDDLESLILTVSDDIFKKLRGMNEEHSILKAIDRYLADNNLSMLAELRREIFDIIGIEISYNYGKTLTFKDEKFIYDQDMEVYEKGKGKRRKVNYEKI